jgi:eukaryotic-like serine/threonine-protein kinase
VLEPGQTVANRYRIEKLLAQGGMGAVFVAEHAGTEERVALKVLHPNALSSKAAVDSFQLEARVGARIKSDHVVKVLDAGYDEALRAPFLVMELLTGSDLERLVRSRGPLPGDEAVVVLRQVASALDKAHEYRDRNHRPAPIVHRDLKPENIFFTLREDGEPCVKILDFGIAKVLSESTTVSREVRGTPLYMAFEQAAGEAVTPATDVWALGLITFFLLTGRCYWLTASRESASVVALFGEILSLPLASPTDRLRELGVANAPWHPAFDGWFARCVNRTASERFRSAGEAVRELAALLLVEGVTAKAARARMALALAATQLGEEQGIGREAPVASVRANSLAGSGRTVSGSVAGSSSPRSKGRAIVAIATTAAVAAGGVLAIVLRAGPWRGTAPGHPATPAATALANSPPPAAPPPTEPRDPAAATSVAQPEPMPPRPTATASTHPQPDNVPVRPATTQAPRATASPTATGGTAAARVPSTPANAPVLPAARASAQYYDTR